MKNATCQECLLSFPFSESYTNEGLCADCFNSFLKCIECKDKKPDQEMYERWNKYFCGDCLEKYSDRYRPIAEPGNVPENVSRLGPKEAMRLARLGNFLP